MSLYFNLKKIIQAMKCEYNVTMRQVRILAPRTLLRWSYYLIHWCHTFCCPHFVHILQNVNTIINASFYMYFKDLLCVYAEFMVNVSATYNLKISAQQKFCNFSGAILLRNYK
jgi:hypothetical protein